MEQTSEVEPLPIIVSSLAIAGAAAIEQTTSADNAVDCPLRLFSFIELLHFLFGSGTICGATLISMS